LELRWEWPRLVSIRHGAPGVSSQKRVTRGTGKRPCVDVPAPVLARIHLAPPARGLAGCGSLPGHVVSLQALEPVLALAD